MVLPIGEGGITDADAAIIDCGVPVRPQLAHPLEAVSPVRITNQHQHSKVDKIMVQEQTQEAKCLSGYRLATTSPAPQSLKMFNVTGK